MAHSASSWASYATTTEASPCKHWSTPSALGRLREVAEKVSADYDAQLAVVHRVGALAIGDIAVALAAAAAHRGQAYEASRALIDQLKEQVPIWKHQTFIDGSDEWVGSC